MTAPLADGYSGLLDDVESPEVEAIEQAHETEDAELEAEGEPVDTEILLAEHTGGGWYALHGGDHDGEKVQGQNNIPDGYEVVDEDED